MLLSNLLVERVTYVRKDDKERKNNVSFSVCLMLNVSQRAPDDKEMYLTLEFPHA